MLKKNAEFIPDDADGSSDDEGDTDGSSDDGVLRMTSEEFDTCLLANNGGDDDSSEEAVNDRLTVGTSLRNFEFWDELKDTHEQMLNRVSRPIPQEFTAGLQRVYPTLWSKWRWLTASLLFVRVVLNVGVTIWQVRETFTISEVNLSESQNATAVFSREGVKECASSGDGCLMHKMSRFDAWRFDAWFEFVFIVPLAVACLSFILPYLLLPQKFPVMSLIHATPRRRPWFFIFGLRLVAGFSSMIFLELMDFKRLKALVWKGERHMWTEIFLCSCWPGRRYSEVETPNKVGCSGSVVIGWKVVHVVMAILFFGFSAQSFLVKLTHMHYAATSDFRGWNFWLWVGYLGFVNQIVGVFSMHDLEFCRVLRFVYGSSDAMIDHGEGRTAAVFFHLLGQRVASRRTRKEKMSKLASVALLSTLDADDLQKLFLSRRQESRFEKAMPKRLKALKDILGSTDAKEFFTQLKQADQQRITEDNDDDVIASRLLEKAKQGHLPFLEQTRDGLLEGVRRRGAKVPKSALLRIAATVQDHIEDVEELCFSGDDDDEHDDKGCLHRCGDFEFLW